MTWPFRFEYIYMTTQIAQTAKFPCIFTAFAKYNSLEGRFNTMKLCLLKYSLKNTRGFDLSRVEKTSRCLSIHSSNLWSFKVHQSRLNEFGHVFKCHEVNKYVAQLVKISIPRFQNSDRKLTVINLYSESLDILVYRNCDRLPRESSLQPSSTFPFGLVSFAFWGRGDTARLQIYSFCISKHQIWASSRLRIQENMELRVMNVSLLYNNVTDDLITSDWLMDSWTTLP